MVSLWGSKKSNSDDEDGAAEQNQTNGGGSAPRRSEDADERTRLLPPRGGDGYLDPDDPAVSPYNLWSVRALRYLSIFFLVITFLWWVLLFVCIFVSPPGLHSRGSGYFDVSFTTLTAGYLATGILFFVVPNRIMEVSSLVLSVILLVDLIIIVATQRLREEESWVGIASVIWAFLITLFNAITNRVVAWGKSEEEERLTGRRETRRSLREWCAVLTSSILVVVYILISVLLTATLIIRSRDVSLEAPGTRYLVDRERYRVHLDCVGNVTYSAAGEKLPTVLLEAGEGPVEDTFDEWIYQTYTDKVIPRYCYWDRPGYAFSDNAPSPHSAGMSVGALSEALAKAGEEGPWVLVGAGFGSIHSRIFSSRHLQDVVGLFLIDPLHEDLLNRVGDPSRGFLLWAYGFVSPLGLRRIFGAIFKGRSREDRVYGRSAFQGGKFLKAKLQENLVAESFTKDEVVQARNIQKVEDTALVVVSSGIEYKKDEEWARKQNDLATITKNLIAHDVVNKAPHEVWTTEEGRKVLTKRLGELLKGAE